MAGPLNGIKIIEFAGIGPAPFCGMMLADHGAQVIRIERPAALTAHQPNAQLKPRDALARSRRSLTLDIKQPSALAVAQDLCAAADGLIEGYRPGVMERLGLGPDALLARNPKLVYGRMTGWGQFGPYAQAAGHDINYIGLAGILHTVGLAGQKPVPPVNYLGDFGGGGMMLAFGMVAALLGVKLGAPGQVIDCAMTDGAALLAAMSYSALAAGEMEDRAGVNQLDGGAHFYGTYETMDGKYIALGAIEPQFYAQFLALVGLAEDPDFDDQLNPAHWPALKNKLAALFRSRTRADWCALLEMTDVCFAPVLSMTEAKAHPHNVARGTFVDVAGWAQPAPAPRYSATINAAPRPAPASGADSDTVLAELGYTAQQLADLRATGALG
jgi:alpha-methylacyl-CoA racemase